MIVENAGNQTANQKKALNVRIISDPNRAILTHLEQPQFKFETK